MNTLHRCAVAAALSAAVGVTLADELSTIVVEDSVAINPNAAEPENINRSRAINADGGDFLSQIPGVSISRFGGRGIEPIIRGQSQTRLNILLDGAYVHGGCPNRMDPPASWAALETYEKVTVLKGVQSLIYGGGGSGGTVLFERDTRSLAEDKGVHGRASVAGSDNGVNSDAMADIVAAGRKAYLRAFGEVKDAGNYEDGKGREVRSAYHHAQGGLALGLTPTPDRLFELSFEKDNFSDALYPGAGMDSPEEQGKLYRLRYEDRFTKGPVDRLKLELYVSDIDHLMNNFSLRTPPVYPTGHPKAGQPMKRQTPTHSKTSGGRLLLDTTTGKNHWQYGIDLQRNERSATLDNLDSGSPVALSFMWPDVTIEQIGLFAENTRTLAGRDRLKYGLRIDHVAASADRVDEKPALVSPNTAYAAYFGHEAEDQDETNVGALLRYEKDLSPRLTLFTGLSRSVRTADATERYMNKWNSVGKKRWIGDPAIAPEKHHQLDLGLLRHGEIATFSAVAWLDRVNDYILRDTARGQNGVLLSDKADIYRNVDAELRGFELEAKVPLGDTLDLSGNLAQVHATNTSDNDRPIAQTPPIEGKLQLDYSRDRWGLGARLRFADRQDRIDPLSKQEVGKTAAWSALDLYANYNLGDHFNLRAGVDNALDRNYARHASRSNLLDPEAIKVNEPGRVVWLKINAEF
ncbi:MAG TPA: TonB-dependent copper receptor [Gammaproteobacteria bacterium]|nr:TonB-dependent copper receptor [Gammaproteobacteria bacterium]